jgi:hypothetical protein
VDTALRVSDPAYLSHPQITVTILLVLEACRRSIILFRTIRLPTLRSTSTTSSTDPMHHTTDHLVSSTAQGLTVRRHHR